MTMTMTMAPTHLRPWTTVRAAELVDVPAVVRMIASPALKPSGDSAPDWEQTRSAMRLVLAHYALEEGRIWVAEREEGGLLAAAVWLPPGVGSEPPDTRFSGLLARELATGRQDPPALPMWLKDVGPGLPHWKVFIVGALDDTSAWDHTVAADLLAPGLRAVDDEAATAVAVTLSPRHGDQLRSLGFRGPREVHLGAGANGWLTTRHPAGGAG
ncbi:hypothetical protein ACOT81_21915 [Streptomyces sp. WI04-05B]|uniref:hypothetical protein n=1 Tax=Streptomyces TaxID=1883 RepID=UPI0029A60943|nr:MULTISPECIES: hypothetical protein [unclassified Streptomyces]MDX2543269.1 hypothetical protein [Streptomyces sp. WI04-05B]MDX2584690.1 hypothetical protein [Streptomyces sp. WI04-05A]